MKMSLNFNFIRNYAMVALATMALTSCANDDFMDDTPSLKAEGMAAAPQGILPGVQPASGPWVTTSATKFFEGYYKSQGNSLPSTFALNQGEKQRYAPGGRSFNGYYYTLNQTKNPSSNLGQRGIRKFSASGGSLTEVGFIQTSGGTFQNQEDEVNFTLFNATTGYYTDGQGLAEGFIGVFNPSTMQTTGNFNVESEVASKVPGYTNASKRRIGTKLLIRRGNYLYADVTFGNDRNRLHQIKQSTQDVYVVAINVNTHNVDKVMVGHEAENIGLFNDHPLVNIDPVTNDIYFATVGDMDKKYGTGTNAGRFSKIFKIDGANNMTPVVSYRDVANTNGLTEDPVNTFSNDKKKEGEFNTLYVYGGKIYTKIADRSVVYGAINFHGQTYRNNIWQYVVIDGGVPHKINIPKDNFYAYQQPQLINGYLYMISNSSAGSNVYRVNLGGSNPTKVTTGTAGGLGWGLLSPDKISSIVKL